MSACGGGDDGVAPPAPSSIDKLSFAAVPKNLDAPPQVQVRASRLLLHASRLALAHPLTGQPLVFDSPPPF